MNDKVEQAANSLTEQYSKVLLDGMQSYGVLAQWTTENGTVIKSKEELGAFIADSPGERLYLSDVYEHFGQRCTLVRVFPLDKPTKTFLIRFDDGQELYCYDWDVWFD